MAGDRMKGPDSKPRSVPDATSAFRIYEPPAEQLIAFPKTPDNQLQKFKDKLARWEVVSSGNEGIKTAEEPEGSGCFYHMASGSGLYVHQVPEGSGRYFYLTLPVYLKGISQLQLDFSVLPDADRLPFQKARFYLLRTRKNLYVVYNMPAEDLYENPRIMSLNVDFKRKDILRDEKGQPVYLSMIEAEELDRLNNLAIHLQRTAKVAEEDTLEPGERYAISTDELKVKLKACRQVTSNDLLFDLAEFSDSIKFASRWQDDIGRHWTITAGRGEEENDFRLYVNPKGIPQQNGSFMAQFRYNRDLCYLVREE
jgi:hypothetical protein